MNLSKLKKTRNQRRLSPGQKRSRAVLLRKEWERQNKKKLNRWRKEWLQKSRKRFRAKKFQQSLGKPLLRKPIYRCAVCLYQAGFDSRMIASQLVITPSNVRQIIYRLGIRQKIARRNRPRLLSVQRISSLILQQYRRETKALLPFDETRHWNNHPICKAWEALKNYRKRSKVRLTAKLAGFKCRHCGRDASAIPVERQRVGLVFCSDQCRKKARIAAEKLRLVSDPQFRSRRRQTAKRCYDRTRRERPEVHIAERRRKQANPQTRIANAHRLRIYLLVKKGRMKKTQPSLKYFGCSQVHLKQHLISQFKRGMTWENYGKVWQVDHIIPLDKFNLQNPAECAVAFNWQNLQPMFSEANRIKSNKLTQAQQPLPLVVH